MKRSLFTLVSLAFLATALYAANPISINHFGETDGRVLAAIDGPEKAGDRFYSADVVRDFSETLLYLNTDLSQADVQIVAQNDNLEVRRFMVRLSVDQATVIDLSDIPELDALIFLSEESFFVTLSDEVDLRPVTVMENVFRGPLMAVRSVDRQNKTSCDLLDTFSTLTCTTPSVCGATTATASGSYERCNDGFPPDVYKLTWGCHSGQSGFQGIVFTSSSCGCRGTATWFANANGDVYQARSKCPGQSEFSTYSVN